MRFEKLPPNIHVQIEDPRTFVPILFFGDVHMGHCNFNSDKFNEVLNWAKEQNAYFVLMGDMIECEIETKHGVNQIREQVVSVDKQIDYIIERFLPFKGKILMSLRGNHENRAKKKADIDPGLRISKELSAPYAGWGTLACFDIGSQRYSVAVHHGSRGSKTPEYQLNQLDKIYCDYDLMAIGHIHQIYYRPLTKVKLDEYGNHDSKRIHRIRTGCFLKYPEYAFEAMYPIDVNGCPAVWFGTQKHSIIVDERRNFTDTTGSWSNDS